jgi:hypothetical protein
MIRKKPNRERRDFFVLLSEGNSLIKDINTFALQINTKA